MAVNRWIGKAVPVAEVKMFVPGNVKPGDFFQITDGNGKYGFRYPSVVPEQDLTDADRGSRVVFDLLRQLNEDDNFFGGGNQERLTFESGFFAGKPALRIQGLSNGQPIPFVSSATPAVANPIVVKQSQAGIDSRDWIFTIRWPTVPTAGKWAVSADGKNPQILDFDATAAELEAALLDLDFPVADIDVTGDHSTGYTVTFEAPTGHVPNPPLMFPIVPPPRVDQVISFTIYEDERVRLTRSGYSDQFWEANYTASQIRTSMNGIGYSASHPVTIVRTPITPSVGWRAGAVYQLTFGSTAAFNDFMAMQKLTQNFTYTDQGAPDVVDTFDKQWILGTYSNPIKIRQVRDNVEIPDMTPWFTNPLERKWTTNAVLYTATSAAILNNDVIPGFTYPQQTQAISQTYNAGSVTIVRTGNPQEEQTFSVVGIEVGELTSESPLSVTVDVAGTLFGLGVDNNADYSIRTINEPGINNMSVLIPELDHNSQTLYRFEWEGQRSPEFAGTATRELVLVAAEALFGVGNVSLGNHASGGYRMEFGGSLSERSIDFSLIRVAESQTIVTQLEANTPMRAWTLRYQFSGGICNGRWRFQTSDGSPGSIWLDWLWDQEPTEADLLQAIYDLDPDYPFVLNASDIQLETEAVGDKYLIREFTVNWKPTPTLGGGTEVEFWCGIDVSELLTARPNVEVQQVGRKAQTEVQFITVENGPTSGNWKLSYNNVETANIVYNATASAVQSALTAIGVNTTVIGGAGGPYIVRWSATGARLSLVGIPGTLTLTNAPTFEAVTVQQGTGPNFFNNPENWSLGHIPATDERIVFADGSTDCSYGLTCGVRLAGIDIYRSWTGQLGLSETRVDGSIETLPNWLEVSFSDSAPLPIRIGLGEVGEGPTVCRLAVSQRPFDATVFYTQSGLRTKPVAFRGSNAENKAVCIAGDIAFGIRPEDVVVLRHLQLVPDGQGDQLVVSAGSGCSIDRFSMTLGTASLSNPPRSIAALGGSLTVYGEGNTRSIDLSSSTVRWLATGVFAGAREVEEVLFSGSLDASSVTPATVRIVCEDHGLSSGDRVYIRAYSGVQGLDGNVYSVQVVDADAFDLLGALAFGTLIDYEGLVHFALADTIVVRSESVLDFDSAGSARDIVAPIRVQGTGVVADAKGTIVDLRLIPEQVEALASFGPSVEIRRRLLG
jgi:hypothetical protein